MAMTISTYENNKIYEQLINQTVESLTIFLSNQPMPLVQEYFPFTLEILHSLKDKLSDEYFFAAWQRVCCSSAS